MGMAIAQQMVKTMNESFTNMSIPGASNPVEKPEQPFFYAIIDNQQTGPFSEQELARLISEKKISKETYIDPWFARLENRTTNTRGFKVSGFISPSISKTPLI